jgi:hypothetical protein
MLLLCAHSNSSSLAFCYQWWEITAFAVTTRMEGSNSNGVSGNDGGGKSMPYQTRSSGIS